MGEKVIFGAPKSRNCSLCEKARSDLWSQLSKIVASYGNRAYARSVVAQLRAIYEPKRQADETYEARVESGARALYLTQGGTERGWPRYPKNAKFFYLRDAEIVLAAAGYKREDKS